MLESESPAESQLSSQTTEADEADQGETQPLSLKQRVLKGSMWTLLGHGANLGLRFASNLILTRLLFPEAFGLMALTQTFLIGLEMFSDIGIVPSIIQNKRGDEPDFLNTAWTVQVVRGVVLWLCACIIAIPVASFNQEPMLMQLLPASGLIVLINGFKSTKWATSNRNLVLARITAIELVSYIIALIVMISGALITRSVWALVIGSVVGSVAEVIASHLLIKGEGNRFHWDPTAFQSMQQFGRWIFINTILGFLSSRGEFLVFGRLLGISTVGIYSLAFNLSRVFNELVIQISGKVLFPSYAELVRERPENLYSALRKSRLLILGAGWSVALFLVIIGKPLIDVLFDDRYSEAGWMLQVLSIGVMFNILNTSYDGILLSMGKAFMITRLMVIAVSLKFIAILVGFYLAGKSGVIFGVAGAELLFYPFVAITFFRISLWQSEIDIPFLCASVLVMAGFYFISGISISL